MEQRSGRLYLLARLHFAIKPQWKDNRLVGYPFRSADPLALLINPSYALLK